ncbi:hypothetical protein B296_00013272 [Ensete ventricosum]|uniref:Uncharacterized protein n=1 Tax=Ensete ventricosum TaxID=4639 RepID=A0A427ALZ7_ENSVE|nr:hypothetical protein B296_00013272 [Ensete ventricosum]
MFSLQKQGAHNKLRVGKGRSEEATERPEILEVLTHGGLLLDDELDGLVARLVAGIGRHEKRLENAIRPQPDVGYDASGAGQPLHSQRHLLRRSLRGRVSRRFQRILRRRQRPHR